MGVWLLIMFDDIWQYDERDDDDDDGDISKVIKHNKPIIKHNQ